MDPATSGQTILTQQQRILLLLAYFGPAFAGSQVQANAYTVQQALEEALEKLNIPLLGRVCLAGRTDAGVHAKGQVAQFDTTTQGLRKIPDLIRALNAVLPDTVSIQDVTATEDSEFHVTRSAQWRWYQYRVFNHPNRSVWMRPDAAWVPQALDVEAMQAAANHLLGEHDFESFQCPHSDVTHRICNVIHSRVYPDGDDVVFDIVANRFLYKMVRNLMGVLLEIGLHGAFTPDDVPRILAEKNRQRAGHTAKPEGLSIMAVQYPEPWGFFQNHVYVTRLNQIAQESRSHEKNILRKAS